VNNGTHRDLHNGGVAPDEENLNKLRPDRVC
jgi:hypothetical protein